MQPPSLSQSGAALRNYSLNNPRIQRAFLPLFNQRTLTSPSQHHFPNVPREPHAFGHANYESCCA
jgi:hypothetical protein